MPVHPTAVVSAQARIDPTAEIGPYAVIEGEVTVGPRSRIFAHAVITGYTTIGSDNEIHYGAVIGDLPQDLAFRNGRSYVVIGDHNVIREGVTIHRGTTPESRTVVGNHCYLMAYSHIAHNCHVADYAKMANGVLLAGYVQVGEGSFISGNSVVHQFVRIGRLCMIAGATRVLMDVPPFMMAHGEGDLVGVNRVGLRRAGWTSAQIQDIRRAYRFLWRGGMSFTRAVDQLAQESDSPLVRELIDFIRAPGKRGIAGPPPHTRRGTKDDDEQD